MYVQCTGIMNGNAGNETGMSLSIRNEATKLAENDNKIAVDHLRVDHIQSNYLNL